MVFSSVILAYISLFAFGLADNIRGPLFSEILTEFGLSNSTGSWIFALSSTFAFLSSFAAASVLRKVTHRHLLQFSLVILAMGLYGFSIAHDLFQMLFAACIFGVSIGFLGVCQNALVVLGTTPQKRKQWLSGLHAMYAISSFLAPMIVAYMASRSADWRSSFQVAAVFPFVVFLVSFFLKASAHHLPEIKSEKVKTPDQSLYLQSLVGACFAFYVVAEIMITSRLGLFYRREMNETLENSSLMVGYFFLFLFASRALFTIFHFKTSLYKMLFISLLSSVIFVCIGLIFNPWFLVFTGFAMGPFYGFSIAYISEIFHEKTNQAIGLAMGMQSSFVVVMHLSFGYLSDILTLKKALWMGPVALTLALFFLWRSHSTHSMEKS